MYFTLLYHHAKATYSKTLFNFVLHGHVNLQTTDESACIGFGMGETITRKRKVVCFLFFERLIIYIGNKAAIAHRRLNS